MKTWQRYMSVAAGIALAAITLRRSVGCVR